MHQEEVGKTQPRLSSAIRESERGRERDTHKGTGAAVRASAGTLPELPPSPAAPSQRCPHTCWTRT